MTQQKLYSQERIKFFIKKYKNIRNLNYQKNFCIMKILLSVRIFSKIHEILKEIYY